MPFKSAKQHRFMRAKHPRIAARWEAEEKAKRKKPKKKKKRRGGKGY